MRVCTEPTLDKIQTINPTRNYCCNQRCDPVGFPKSFSKGFCFLSQNIMSPNQNIEAVVLVTFTKFFITNFGNNIR